MKCISTDICTKCNSNDGYYLHNKKCIRTCPNGFILYSDSLLG